MLRRTWVYRQHFRKKMAAMRMVDATYRITTHVKLSSMSFYLQLFVQETSLGVSCLSMPMLCGTMGCSVTTRQRNVSDHVSVNKKVRAQQNFKSQNVLNVLINTSHTDLEDAKTGFWADIRKMAAIHGGRVSHHCRRSLRHVEGGNGRYKLVVCGPKPQDILDLFWQMHPLQSAENMWQDRWGAECMFEHKDAAHVGAEPDQATSGATAAARPAQRMRNVSDAGCMWQERSGADSVLENEHLDAAPMDADAPWGVASEDFVKECVDWGETDEEWSDWSADALRLE